MSAHPLKLTVLLALMQASPVFAALPNGVASGDITQSSAWLWARSDTTGLVNFEVATDAAFANVVNTFNAAVVDPMQPVKGVVNGLAAGQQYYYRATDATLSSFNGSFRTAAAAGSHNGLRFGVSAFRVTGAANWRLTPRSRTSRRRIWISSSSMAIPFTPSAIPARHSPLPVRSPTIAIAITKCCPPATA